MKHLMKKIALSVAAVSLASVVQAETVLKLGSPAPPGSPWGKWINGVAEKIAEVSGGDLKLNLLIGGQAGDEQTIIRQTVKGRLDIAFVSNVPLTLLANEMALTSAPYLFDSVDQGTCVAHNHLAGTMGEIMDSSGVVPLTWMEVGHYVFFSKDAITGPADLKGLKVRTAPTMADSVLADQLGFSAVPLGNTDAIPALQTGNVQAAVYPTVYGIAIGTHKVAPHVTVSNHSRLIGSVAVSKRSWNKLSTEHQQILSTVFSAAGPALTQGILGAEKALLGKLEAAGLPVRHLSAEEEAQWRAATAGSLDKLVAEAGGDAQAVADAINAAKQACGS